MKKNSILKLAVLVSLGVGAVGCQTVGTNKYGCSGLPDGIICKSPTQIYDQTNGDIEGVYQYQDNQAKVEDDGMFKSSRSEKQRKNTTQNVQVLNAEVSPFAKPAYKAHSNPIPVLEQPKVLRIWIAPWVDQNETLNYPSYKFTEITPRKWNFGGNPQFRNVLPVTAPNNSADFQSASAVVEPASAPSQQQSFTNTSTAGVSEQGLAKQNEMVNQMATESFHTDQTSQGLPAQQGQ